MKTCFTQADADECLAALCSELARHSPGWPHRGFECRAGLRDFAREISVVVFGSGADFWQSHFSVKYPPTRASIALAAMKAVTLLDDVTARREAEALLVDEHARRRQFMGA